jgi:hypothetical protein
MKSAVIVMALVGLVGCASSRPQPQAMSYDQLSKIRVASYDCRNIDFYISNMKEQLSRKGLLNANPEDLNDEDRKYNATARIVIWSMIIGCNNPDRYKKS